MRYEKIKSMVLLSLACLFSISIFTTYGEDNAVRQQFRNDMNRVASFWKDNRNAHVDANQVSGIAADIETNWKDTDKEKYAMLMLRLVGPLKSKSKDNQLQNDTVRQYLLTAMEEPNQVPVKLQINIATELMKSWPELDKKGKNTVLTQNELAQRRTNDALIVLRAWQNFDGLIDPNWSPEDRPKRNTVKQELAAKSKGDPKAEVAPKSRKTGQYFEQLALRKMQKRFKNQMRQFLTEVYCCEPYNTVELQSYLDENVTDIAVKERILAEINKSISIQNNN